MSRYGIAAVFQGLDQSRDAPKSRADLVNANTKHAVMPIRPARHDHSMVGDLPGLPRTRRQFILICGDHAALSSRGAAAGACQRRVSHRPDFSNFLPPRPRRRAGSLRSFEKILGDAHFAVLIKSAAPERRQHSNYDLTRQHEDSAHAGEFSQSQGTTRPSRADKFNMGRWKCWKESVRRRKEFGKIFLK